MLVRLVKTKDITLYKNSGESLTSFEQENSILGREMSQFLVIIFDTIYADLAFNID